MFKIDKVDCKQIFFFNVKDAATRNKSLDSEIQAKKNTSKTRYEKRMDEAVKELNLHQQQQQQQQRLTRSPKR